jgi:ssDNA-binding Zn-finger/Zn-ribbon topoisomerase 1
VSLPHKTIGSVGRGTHAMNEAYVRLLCPECKKEWESSPSDLPPHDTTFHCPNCHNSRRLAEFARTDHDLETMKSLG